MPDNILSIPFSDKSSDSSPVGVFCLLNRTGPIYEDYELQCLVQACKSVAIIISNNELYRSAIQLTKVENEKKEKALIELKKSKILLEFAVSLYQQEDLSRLTEQIILRARDRGLNPKKWSLA